MSMMTRRTALQGLLAAGAAAVLDPARPRSATAATAAAAEPAAPEGFHLRYGLASSMYGTTKLAEILPEVTKTGCEMIDLWPRPHGNQREQAAELGREKLEELLAEHKVQLGMTTRYDLGPYKLADEIDFVSGLGGKLIVCGAKNAPGETLKAKVRNFLTSLEPTAELAAEHGVTIGIENHANSLINTPDSLRYFAEFNKQPSLGIALAPYHLPQDGALLAELITTLDQNLVHFYAWQHGQGAMKKLPKDEEMEQMPGRGELDFAPLLKALKTIEYKRWTQVFMHPVPRGIPILATTGEVTAAINESRQYLDTKIAGLD